MCGISYFDLVKEAAEEHDYSFTLNCPEKLGRGRGKDRMILHVAFALT